MKGLRSSLIVVALLCFQCRILSAQSGQSEWRQKLPDNCYEILHEEADSSQEQKDHCVSQFQGVTTVIVSASRREQELSSVAAPVALIPSAEVERRSADSVAELLRDIPGIEVSDAGEAGHKRIRVRGEQARRVMILIDGQEFDDQREVGTPILIAPEMIERIEVVRGPGSVIYGSKAIGGVINIITKKGGYHPAQGGVSSTYDSSSNGWQQFGTFYGSHAGFDYRLAGVTADHGERDTPHGDLDNTAYSLGSLMGYLGKRFENHALAVSFDLYESESDVFVEDRVRTSPPFLDFAIDIPQRDRKKVGIFYDWRDISENLEKFHIDAYYQQSERDFNTFSKTLIDIGFPLLSDTAIRSESELENIGATAQADLRIFEDHLVIIGYQLNLDDLSQDRLRSVISNGVPKPNEFVEDEASRDSHSIFVQDEWSVIEDTVFTAGARAYFLDAELEKTTRPGLSPASSSDNDVIFSAGLSYTGIPDSTLWGRVAQGYLYPTLTELATGAFAGPDYVNPNPELSSETSISYDAGYRLTADRWSTEISAFFSDADDLIDFVRCSESTAFCLEPSGRNDRVYVNIDRAKSYGAESTVSYQAEEFMPYISLAWIRRKERSAMLETYDTGLAPVTARWGLRWERDLTSSLGSWADIYFRSSSDSDERESASEIEHKSGWTTLNVSGGLLFGSKRRSRLIVELKNITDKFYIPASENLAAQGLGAAVKLAIEF